MPLSGSRFWPRFHTSSETTGADTHVDSCGDVFSDAGSIPAASMLTAAYFMLRDETDYHALGGWYLADRDKHPVTQHLLRRLQDLGVEAKVKTTSVSVHRKFLCSHKMHTGLTLVSLTLSLPLRFLL